MASAPQTLAIELEIARDHQHHNQGVTSWTVPLVLVAVVVFCHLVVARR